MVKQKKFKSILIVLAVFLLLFISACTVGLPGTQGTNKKIIELFHAIAVWQNKNDKGDTDIYYSIYNDNKKQWFNYENNKATAVLKEIQGNDFDPDIYSNDEIAISVWAHKGNNGFQIYYSIFGGKKWSEPKTVSELSGNNLDPTIAMNSNNALVVWVNEYQGKRQLYYSVYDIANDQWSKPKSLFGSFNADLKEKIVLPESVSLPELTFNARGLYLLVFIGEVNGKALAFISSFANNSWSYPEIIPQQKIPAKLDLSNPTKERTGISSDLGGLTTIVWPAKNNFVYAAEWNKKITKVKFVDSGKKPDTAYDSAGISHALYTKNKINENFSLLQHSYNVLNINVRKETLDTQENDERNSLVFIKKRLKGLAVWFSDTTKPSEIYYSLLENKWSEPKTIEPATLSGQDLNPAVTPIEKITVIEEEQPYCGNGNIEAGEQCEVGVPCKNPLAVCDLTDCSCKIPPINFCGDGIVQTPNFFGQMEECEKGVKCKNPADVCIVNACKCISDILPPPDGNESLPPNTVSCSSNSDYVNEFDKNPFDKKLQVCKDDCPEGYKCWPNSCTCTKEEVDLNKTKLSCSQRTNTLETEGILDSLGNNEVCVDDCSGLGKGEAGLDFYCNEDCYCEEKSLVSCYNETIDAVGQGRGSSFNSKAEICIDSCPEGLTCNNECVCVDDSGKIPKKLKALCSKGGVYDANFEITATYDSNYMYCSDDCPSGQTCNPESCTCETTQKTDYSCSTGTYDTPFDPSQNNCVDQCPSGYTCNAESCICEQKPSYSCAGPNDNPFDSATYVCQDNCQEGYSCNTESCSCEAIDSDSDGVIDLQDNCVTTANTDQADVDEDGIGDVCDTCPQDPQNDSDHDGVCGNVDNCPNIPNHNQEDSDGDGIGDYCDTEPFGPNHCGDYAAQQEWGVSQGLTINVLAKGNVSQTSCNQLANQQGEVITCNTLCRYGYWKQWTWTVNNQTVNSYSCCWGATKYLSCTDCPGQNPVCPDSTACAQYTPFPQSS